jgi:hypothetical protein
LGGRVPHQVRPADRPNAETRPSARPSARPLARPLARPSARPAASWAASVAPDVEHPCRFGSRDAEHRSRVGLAGSRSPRTGAGGCARARLGSSPNQALRGNEPFTGLCIPTGQNSSNVVPLDDASEACRVGGSAEPTSRFLAAVGVIARRTLGAAPCRAVRRRTGQPFRLEVADDTADHPADVASSPAQRGHRELHEIAETRPPAGIPKGNLQTCARRIWSSGTSRSCVGRGFGRGRVGSDGSSFDGVRVGGLGRCVDGAAAWRRSIRAVMAATLGAVSSSSATWRTCALKSRWRVCRVHSGAVPAGADPIRLLCGKRRRSGPRRARWQTRAGLRTGPCVTISGAPPVGHGLGVVDRGEVSTVWFS